MRLFTLPWIGFFAVACVPALPPPAHWGSTPATILREETTGVVTGSCCLAGNVDVAVPVADIAVVDAGAQVNSNHVAGSVGVWIRSAGDADTSARGGARFAAVGGTGDLLGAIPFAMPFAGAQFVGQYAVQYDQGSVFAFTGGAELSVPLTPDRSMQDITSTVTTLTTTGPGTLEVQEQQVVVAVPLPILWVLLDATGEFPIAQDRVAIVIGGQLRLAIWPIPIPIPTASLGLRL